MRFEGRVALVTGAASGIGRATAERLSADGAAVMCTDINLAGAEETANTIRQRQGSAESLELDVTDGDAFRDALSIAESKLGAVDVLFNNAGIAGGGWEATIAVNLTGVFTGLLHGTMYMAARGGGSIVNTASIAGLVALVGPPDIPHPTEDETRAPAAAYVASKHGVAGLTKQFAINYGRQNVRVNAVAPGYIETPMTEGMWANPEFGRYIESLHPAGRRGYAEEVAAAVAFLASDEASFITGVVLPVDGGYSAR